MCFVVVALDAERGCCMCECVWCSGSHGVDLSRFIKEPHTLDTFGLPKDHKRPISLQHILYTVSVHRFLNLDFHFVKSSSFTIVAR